MQIASEDWAISLIDDRHVRIYDVDGSHEDFSLLDAIRIAMWVIKYMQEAGKYLDPKEDKEA